MRCRMPAPWPAAVACAATSTVAAEAPGTLRLDYLPHRRARRRDLSRVDRVVVEPLPWPGNLARTADAGELGAYRFEVRDAGGQLLYARGYASIYGEWITTAEAAQPHRTFHESLRFPVPAGPVEVTVLRRRRRTSRFATRLAHPGRSRRSVRACARRRHARS